MKNNPLGRKANIVVQETDSEVLIYDLSNNKAFCLNETSAIVWQLCDGNNSVAEISRELGNKLNSPANEDLVWFAIDQLKKEKLIENEAEFDNYFAGMNRREVIKKVGLGSMIALPFVASIVAPFSANAASGGLADGQTCSTNNECLNDCCVGLMCNAGNRPTTTVCTFDCQCLSNSCLGPSGAMTCV